MSWVAVPRRGLHGSAGVVFHVLNRGVRRLRVFEDASAYRSFIQVLQEGQERTSIRLFGLLCDAQPLSPCRVAGAGRPNG